MNIDEIKKVVGSYVFTSDNFIKMILILFRIQANIPVIMMGETGCGKTSLIRIISQLLANDKKSRNEKKEEEKKNIDKKDGINEMKTLNIHAGISDKDIIDFMEGKTKDNGINLIEEIYEEKDYKKIIEELENAINSIDEDITKLPNETEDQLKIRKENIKNNFENQMKEIKENILEKE